jgi:hypothetical protein
LLRVRVTVVAMQKQQRFLYILLRHMSIIWKYWLSQESLLRIMSVPRQPYKILKSSYKVPNIFVRVESNSVFLDRFLLKPPFSNFTWIRAVGAALILANRSKDVTKLKALFTTTRTRLRKYAVLQPWIVWPSKSWDFSESRWILTANLGLRFVLCCYKRESALFPIV